MAYDNNELNDLFDTFEAKLDKCYNSLTYEFQQMKAGRANPHILDKVLVDYYGTETPLTQMANIAVPEARLMTISVWDVSMLKAVEKAITAANLGITPNNDGKIIRMIFPELTEERRKDLAKQLKQLAEGTKVALRNARRDINESLRKLKKDSAITEDDCASCEKDVDKQLADYIDSVDKVTKDKEKEIMSV